MAVLQEKLRLAKEKVAKVTACDNQSSQFMPQGWGGGGRSVIQVPVCLHYNLQTHKAFVKFELKLLSVFCDITTCFTNH